MSYHPWGSGGSHEPRLQINGLLLCHMKKLMAEIFSTFLCSFNTYLELASYSFVQTTIITLIIIILNAVPLDNGHGFKKWVWLANFHKLNLLAKSCIHPCIIIVYACRYAFQNVSQFLLCIPINTVSYVLIDTFLNTFCLAFNSGPK